MALKAIPQARSMKKQIGFPLLLLTACAVLIAPYIPELVMPLWVTEACWQGTVYVDEAFAVETTVPACWLVN